MRILGCIINYGHCERRETGAIRILNDALSNSEGSDYVVQKPYKQEHQSCTCELVLGRRTLYDTHSSRRVSLQIFRPAVELNVAPPAHWKGASQLLSQSSVSVSFDRSISPEVPSAQHRHVNAAIDQRTKIDTGGWLARHTQMTLIARDSVLRS